MTETERLVDAFAAYDRTWQQGQLNHDHRAAVAVAGARVNLVLRLADCGYDPEPEVTAQVRRDVHLLYNGDRAEVAAAA